MNILNIFMFSDSFNDVVDSYILLIVECTINNIRYNINSIVYKPIWDAFISINTLELWQNLDINIYSHDNKYSKCENVKFFGSAVINDKAIMTLIECADISNLTELITTYVHKYIINDNLSREKYGLNNELFDD